MVKVSVIIPVYNVEPYLKQCMDSVVGQTLKDIEIICVDDGSTDGSLDILKEYATEDSRIQIIEQKNAGAGAARNNGMRHATGKYLSFLDSDDFFEPRMLEKAYDLAEKDQADFSDGDSVTAESAADDTQEDMTDGSDNDIQEESSAVSEIPEEPDQKTTQNDLPEDDLTGEENQPSEDLSDNPSAGELSEKPEELRISDTHLASCWMNIKELYEAQEEAE